MNKQYTIKIIKNLNLSINYYSGETNLHDFCSVVEAQGDNPEWKPDYNLLVDIRNANTYISSKEIGTLKDYIEKKLPHLKSLAIITKTPQQVVKSILFENAFEHSKTKVEIFSTISAAIAWLGISIDQLSSIEKAIGSLAKEIQ